MQKIKIKFVHYTKWVSEGIGEGRKDIIVSIDNNDSLATNEQVEKIAKNDGLTYVQFFNWFYKVTRYRDETFEGQIIHWTDLKY